METRGNKKVRERRALSRVAAVVALAAAFLLLCLDVYSGARDPKEITTASGVRMVALSSGTFMMGDAKGEIDEHRHEVTVSPFAIDESEVTQDEYERVMGENPSKVKGGGNPVEQVRWSDAVRYCNERSRLDGLEPAYDLKTWTCRFEANGYRLPTEAEWEYAARAGSETPYSFGKSGSDLKRHAWYEANSGGKPKPVQQRRPNAWGLHDMHGNVWEWCNDFYGVDYYRKSPEKDPRGPASGDKKVLRGGCWNSAPDACRSAYRYNENPGYTDACFGYDIYGFRCVRSMKPDRPE
jgi:formylglycine-generating enzyme required for sulfatase activity